MSRSIEVLGSLIFAIAVLHIFSVKRFLHWAKRFRQGSLPERFLHLMGEIEVVFGLWAGIFLAAITVFVNFDTSVQYLEGLNFTEPAFVFTVMTVAATRPLVYAASMLVRFLARFLPLAPSVAFYFVILTVGPLLGSFITEPAAMTVCALILKDAFLDRGGSSKFLYLSLAVLFVNISIGGVLTHFAAPPVLMVAGTWGWDMAHMFTQFGWKAVIAVVINACIVTFLFREFLRGLPVERKVEAKIPAWLILMHLGFLFTVVFSAHHPLVFFGFFLFFLGLTTVTEEFQEELKIKESLLVAFFLAGLVVLGGVQRWWLEPTLMSLTPTPLFVGTTFLTALMDNAALTYLGAQVPGIADSLKYALVAGAVAGGGLTVIANAPNPAGFTILGPSFGSGGISPMGLFLSALPFTLIAMACFWFLG